jgi:cytoskeletal protein CcmA (bactofilin family)
MSQARFTLPAGVDLTVEDGKLNVRYEGDVTLEQSMGLDLGSVQAGGDLHVALPRITGSLTAGGALTLEGAIDAEHVEAPQLSLPSGASVSSVRTAGALTCGDLSTASIDVGGDLSGGAVEASGDVSIGGSAAATSISSGGTVNIEGDIQATSIAARQVTLSGGSVKAKAISATETIVVGPGRITVDVLIAPSVTIDPGARTRHRDRVAQRPRRLQGEGRSLGG